MEWYWHIVNVNWYGWDDSISNQEVKAALVPNFCKWAVVPGNFCFAFWIEFCFGACGSYNFWYSVTQKETLFTLLEFWNSEHKINLLEFTWRMLLTLAEVCCNYFCFCLPYARILLLLIFQELPHQCFFGYPDRKKIALLNYQ